MDPKLMIEISDLVMKSAKSLDVRLADLLKLEALKKEFTEGQVEPIAVHNFNGFSGYNFWAGGNLIAQLQMSSLTSGYYTFWKKEIYILDDLHLNENGNQMLAEIIYKEAFK